MKSRLFFLFVIFISVNHNIYSQEPTTSIDYSSALKDTLHRLALNSDNEFFKMHCNSMIKVIDGRPNLPLWETDLLKEFYDAINNLSDTSNPRDLSTYLKRQRPFILAWISPTDGSVSLTQIKPPKNWDPDEEYPLYISLHGLGAAVSTIVHMVKPMLSKPSTDSAFEDGFLVSPWGRGDGMYINMAETDIWECLDTVESVLKINPARKYLTGHSMGGWGAWHLGIKSAHKWAALGIHAGALEYNKSSMLKPEEVQKIKDVPTYIVVGTDDELFRANQTAYNLLVETGNPNIKFVTFDGGHVLRSENVENMYLWIRNFVNDDWYISDIENPQNINQQLQIYCYPNPFNANTTISYSVPKSEFVGLRVYNSIGQLSEILVNGVQSAGKQELSWTPKDLTPGIYYCRLTYGDITKATRIVYIKE